MLKVAILDDFEALAKLTAGPLTVAGYDVRIWTSPIDFEEILNFGPRLIEINLYRKKDAFDRPIRNLEEDVRGFKPLVELEQYPTAQVIPIMLVGIGILEEAIPTSVNYDLFLSFPEDIDLYLPGVLDLTTKKKGYRRISGYICPNCGGRLTFSMEPVRDLFCPRCHTAVAIINSESCWYLPPGGPSIPCSMEQLKPPNLEAE